MADPRPPTRPRADAARQPVAPIQRLALRLDEVAAALGVSRRTIERERSAGRFPKPDLHLGRMPLWTIATVHRWTEGGVIDHGR